MLFPILDEKTESVIQFGDKITFDGSQSFVSEGSNPITTWEIDPGDGSGFQNVTSTKGVLSWVYSGASTADLTVSLRIGDGSTTETVARPLKTITEADDKLFSGDADLFPHEPDIYQYLPAGKSSFKYAHRQAQELMFDYLDETRSHDQFGNRLDKDNIVSTEDLKKWSKYQTLVVIYESMVRNADDIFSQKADSYASLMFPARSKAVLRLDLNKDGTEDTKRDTRSVILARR